MSKTFGNFTFNETKIEANADVDFNCYSKIYTYLKENPENIQDSQNSVSKLFDVQKNKLTSILRNKDKNTWNINFLESKHVNLACSVIKFMKDMIQLDLLSPQREKDFLNFLISFLRLKHIIICTMKISNIIQGDMIRK